ncbi:MAG: ABC transporter permease [Candidatus Heimdallarchaeota archaeon]|nr:ABC transporter permease [Candidatus Heimdallarchaeota archaeon]
MNELVNIEYSEKPPQGITYFQSMKYLWVITIIGLSSYLFAIFFIFYGTIILLSDVHRDLYYNLSIASFISAFIIVILGRIIVKKFGIEELFINDKQIIIASKFIGTNTIAMSDILYVKIEKINPVLDFLSLTAPSVIVATHKKIFKIKSLKYQDKDGFIEFFREFEMKYQDEFVIFYHKSKGSISRLIFRFTQDTGGVIGLTIIVIFAFLALWGAFAMIISPIGGYNIYTLFLRNPDFLNFELEGYSYEDTVLAPPSADFWFGTDFIGRDLFARLIFGTSFTFLIAITGAVLSIFFILLFGLLSSFNPGWIDNFIMRVSDSLLSFPPFIFLIVFSAASMFLRESIQGGFFLAVYIGMAFVTWPMGARIIRAEVQQLMSSEFILASRHLGASKFTLLRKHVIPQISPTIMIIFTYQVSDIIIGTTLLGFIGFASESTLIWGSDLSHALFGFSFLEHWWTVFFPSLFIFLLVFGLTLFSDSVRDNMDPRLIGGVKALPYEIRKELDL